MQTVAIGALWISLVMATAALAQNQALRQEDRTFGARAQDVPLRAALQHPVLRDAGSVPGRSGFGSTVPVLSLGAPALRLGERHRWIVELTAANNSSLEITPELKCTFMNGEKPVETVSVFLDGLQPGRKVAFDIYGPPGEVVIDKAPCIAVGPWR